MEVEKTVGETEVPRDVQKDIDSAAKRQENRWREREAKKEAERRVKSIGGPLKAEKATTRRSNTFKGICEMCGREAAVIVTDEGDFCGDCMGKMPWLK